MKKLYKVKLSVEIMVVAENEIEAVSVAKSNCEEEIKTFGIALAFLTSDIHDIPQNWQDSIPYGADKKCYQILMEKNDKVVLPEDEMRDIIKIKDESKENKVEIREKKEPKQKNLNWQENSQKTPKLRFI